MKTTHTCWLCVHVPVIAFCCASVRVTDANLLGLARESSPVSPSAPSGSGDADSTMSVRLRLPKLMRSASSELPWDVRDALDCVMSSVILACNQNEANQRVTSWRELRMDDPVIEQSFYRDAVPPSTELQNQDSRVGSVIPSNQV